RGLARADSTNEYSNQFKATQTWNKIAREFRAKMPTKKHWRQLRSFENSFTGKEATDFMLTILPGLLPNKKEITRESCVSLLQKFADNNLFKYAWTADKTTFQDNATLFVWNGDSTLNGVCRTPVLMRRANSFNNGSADRPRKTVLITPKPEISTPDTWKTFELPKSPPKHKHSRNRRLSSSTGNLSLIGIEKFDSLLSPRMGDRAPIIEEGLISPDRREVKEGIEYGEIRKDKKKEYGELGNAKENAYGEIGKKMESLLGEIGRKKESIYGEIVRKTKEPMCVAPKESTKEDGKPPTPNLLRSSPVYASFIKREDRHDVDKENSYEYVTFRRKNMMHTTPSKMLKRGVQSTKEKKDKDGNQTKSVFSRLTPSRLKGKENDTRELSPPHPPAPPPSVQPSRKEDSIYSSIRIRPRAILTDADEWNVYSTALSNRVRSLLGNIEEKDNLMTWNVDGQQVKWSCKYHPMGKVVRAMKQNDDWPAPLVQQMEYLKHFPFHTKNVTVITYTDKQEVKVFRTVVAHLKKNSPLLHSSVGQAFLRVINHFKKLSAPLTRPSSANSGGSIRLETAFSVGSPTTRLLPQARRGRGEWTGEGVVSQSSISSLNEHPSMEGVQSTKENLPVDSVEMSFDASLIPTAFTHRHTLHSTPPQGPLRVDPSSGMKATDILMEPLGDRILRLPGLKHSPDLIERIKNLSPRVSAIPFPLDTVTRPRRGLDDPPVLDPPLLEGISIDMDPALFETLQLLLLSLPVGTRRKLQLILKFINDISNNHCLSLQENRENRYVALDELCDYILAANDDCSMGSSLSHSERINLVSMLIDNESRLFRIPDDFVSRVDTVLMERRRTKQLEFDDGSPSIAPIAPNYCQRIQPEAYTIQMNETNCSLRSLLEGIISNSKMSSSEREKKLKAFEKSHPSIYYSRFPERIQKKQEGGFLHKIFRSRND
ncbi:hypothetical protein PMAYCL1PPCAC_06913, partial [Pristionchus mayeri]